MLENFTCFKKENNIFSFSQLYSRKDDDLKTKQLIVATNITIFAVNDLLQATSSNMKEEELFDTKNLFDKYLHTNFANKEEKQNLLNNLKNSFEILEKKLKNANKLSY